MKKVKSTCLKVLIITIVFAAYILSTSANTNTQRSNYTKKSALQYLVKDILLSGDTKGRAILIPHLTEDMINFDYNNNREIKYWGILNKYYPELTKKELEKMVAIAPKINKEMINDLPNVIIKTNPRTKTYAFNLITLKFTPMIYLSNIIYSKDKKTCIIYVNENNQSGATLEIKQNAKGEWNSYTFTGDWLND
jgi:hypothetical protein